MSADAQGECSVSIQKILTFTLPADKFTQKKNAFSRCVFVPPCYIVAGQRSGTILRWTIPEKIQETVLYPTIEVTKHLGVISCLHWSESLNLLFSGSSDRRVLVWDLLGKTPKTAPLQELTEFEETPLAIDTFQNYLFVVESRGITIFTQQGLKGAAGSGFIFKRIYFIKKNGTHKIHIYSNSRVDNSGYIYAAFDNGTLLQYDMQLSDHPSFLANNRPKRISEHGIYDIVYNPRTENLLTFSYSPVLRIFNPKNYIITSSITNPHQKNYVNGCCTREGTLILLDVAGNLFIYDAQEKISSLFETKLDMGGLGVFPACWTKESQDKFLFLLRDTITLYEINRGTVKASYKVHSKNVFYAKISHDSNQTVLITVGDDRYIRLWDPGDFSLRHEYKIPTHLAILSAYVDVRERLTTDMLWAVTGHDDGRIIFFNLTNEKSVELPSRHRNSISTLTVTASEMKCVMFACDYDGYISVWSIDAILENLSYAAVSLLRMWKAHDREILASASSWVSGYPVVATGGNDCVIKLWTDVEGNQTVNELNGHTDSVTSLHFDGFFLFSGSEDFSIRIWDTQNLVQLFVIPNLHTSAIRQVISVPDENKLASCDAKGNIYIYDYVKKTSIFEMHHSTDCKAIYIDKAKETLYACVKREIIPHQLPKGKIFSVQGLPPLRSQKSLMRF